MDDAPLPDDDPDLALARGLGADARRDAPSADPLGHLLAAHRDGLGGTPRVGAARTDALWARVAAQTTPDVRAPLAPPRARPALRWTAFAAAGLAALVAVGVWRLRAPEVAEYPAFAAEAGGAVRTVTLPDGSRVALRPGATLAGVEGGRGRVRYRLTGEAFFSVAHDPARTFEVEAAGATVAVLGTRFAVVAGDSAADVYLERGSVALTAASGARVVLAPGQSATARARTVTPPAPADREIALDWLSGRVVFARRAAGEVAAELGQHYGRTLRLPEGVAAETVSGTLALGPEAETLAAFGRVLGGRFVAEGPGAYRLVR